MRLHFLGVRGSTPAPGAEYLRYGGHTSCVAVSRGDGAPTLILDAGTGIRRASALCDGAFAGTILLSHLHWDHLHGLPFFSSGDREGSRVHVALPESEIGEEPLAALTRGMSPPHFPVGPHELRGSWSFSALREGPVDLEGFEVVARQVPHKGGRTFGYRVSDGHGVVAYLPDHCPTDVGPGPEGWGEYHEAAMELASGADVLIHDSFMTAEEVERDAFLGHAAVEYVVGLARRAGCATTVLFHHRPDRTDDELDSIAARVAGDPGVVVATETLVLDA
ncbi:MAG: MBL fold metallo-hydrolase [Acidimicrobiales bacterium]